MRPPGDLPDNIIRINKLVYLVPKSFLFGVPNNSGPGV
jgi:hypothetical protein